MERSNMPDKIWATEKDGEVYTTHDPKTVASVKAKGHKITEYISTSPAREHAEQMQEALKSISIVRGANKGSYSFRLQFPPMQSPTGVRFEEYAILIDGSNIPVVEELIAKWNESIGCLLATIKAEERREEEDNG